MLMKNIITNNHFIIFGVIFSLLFGILLRFYNVNYEDLWFDELVSFWVSDPDILLAESFERNNSSEGTPFFFNFILKFFHKIFGYEPYVGRYLSATLGVLCIFSISYLAKIIKNDNSYILVMFLISLNVFLIKYSQELRVYSLMLFLNSLTLIHFIKITNHLDENKKVMANYFLFIFFQSCAVLSHPFSLIVFFSLILYLIIKLIFQKKSYKYLNYSILILLLFLLIYIPFYVVNTEPYPTWVKHHDPGFYTNYYFSKFFGSRLLGLIHLIILFFLMFKFRKKIIRDMKIETLLILIIFLSYFLPIIFGYMHEPILAPRYIIFVIMPIILLLCILIFELKNEILKFFFISLIVLTTIGNQITESNVQQFFKERPHYKSEFSKSLNEINKSDYKKFAINMGFAESNTKPYNQAIENYLNKLIEQKDLKNTFIKDISLNDQKNAHIWIICLEDLVTSNCDNFDIIKKYDILEKKFVNNVQLRLIKIL